MKELLYIDKIKNILSDSSYLGDDCAYFSSDIFKNKGLFVTQDSLVEGVHFSLDYMTPYQLGQKSINVNLSDLAAMCAEPVFVTISLSLPNTVNENFVEDFYKGVNEVCKQYGIVVAGGDITASYKVYVSICAVGKSIMKYFVSRSYAEPKDIVAVTGVHGDSAGGLRLLCEKRDINEILINAHVNPSAQIYKSRLLAQTASKNFAMMDSSDGLGDALYKLSVASNVKMNIDLNNVPVSKDLKDVFPKDYKNLVLWGGEDYQLVFCMSLNDFEKLDNKKFFKIGVVEETNSNPAVYINDEGKNVIINEQTFLEKSYNHFYTKEDKR